MLNKSAVGIYVPHTGAGLRMGNPTSIALNSDRETKGFTFSLLRLRLQQLVRLGLDCSKRIQKTLIKTYSGADPFLLGRLR